jgi:hypothetical protein
MESADQNMIAQQISEWLRRQIILRDKDHGDCSRIQLRHLNVERQIQGDVASIPVKLDHGSEDLEPLLNSICSTAQRDADDLNAGVQNYAIYAFFPQDLNYLPRKVFRVAGVNEAFERELTPSEPPTEKGIVSQLMRHTENIMKTQTVSTGYIVGTLQRENQRQSEMLEKFSQQQIDFMLLLQETMDTAHGRRLKEKAEEVNLAMRQDVIEKLGSLVPVVINRIAGKTVMPIQDPAFNLMGTLLESLDDEQQLAFLNSLKPNQKPLFAEMLSEYEKRKAAASGDQPNFIQQSIGRKNELPAAQPDNSTRQSDNSDLLTSHPNTPQLARFKTIADRLRENPKLISSDPVIQEIERKARDFANRFRDQLQPPNPTKPGAS